ncbi:hypothetical protein B0H13DRAFT_1896672 [Mycena leptocephala]|nr:hypothetical protein B0H13DRAFT_1896672 [Mycena leptocephala]
MPPSSSPAPSLPRYLSPCGPAARRPRLSCTGASARTTPRVCVQRSRRLFFVAAAPLFGCPPTTAIFSRHRTPPRSQAGLLDPVPITGAALVAFSPAATVYRRTRTRGPISRRPHERHGRGLRLPDIPALLHAASASQDRDALDARESADSQLRETAAAFHRGTPAASAGAGAGEDPEEYCKNAGSADLDLDLDTLLVFEKDKNPGSCKKFGSLLKEVQRLVVGFRDALTLCKSRSCRISSYLFCDENEIMEKVQTHKRTSRNQNTRLGERFPQEMYSGTAPSTRCQSWTKTKKQLMARLDRKVNEWQKSQEADEADPVLPAHAATGLWPTGDFNMRLRSRGPPSKAPR